MRKLVAGHWVDFCWRSQRSEDMWRKVLLNLSEETRKKHAFPKIREDGVGFEVIPSLQL